jgi:hypothetical protein
MMHCVVEGHRVREGSSLDLYTGLQEGTSLTGIPSAWIACRAIHWPPQHRRLIALGQMLPGMQNGLKKRWNALRLAFGMCQLSHDSMPLTYITHVAFSALAMLHTLAAR